MWTYKINGKQNKWALMALETYITGSAEIVANKQYVVAD